MLEDDDASNLVFITSNEGIESEQTFNISVIATSNTAQENNDFEIVNMQVLFPANATRVVVPINFVNESIQEEEENFRLQLVYKGNGPPFRVGGNVITTVYIRNDDEGKLKR